MTTKVDFKKEFKELYQPAKIPHLIEVPPMIFLTVTGQGAPGSESYQQALELLYALSYTIKMSDKSGQAPPGFYDYSVLPLEGLWWTDDGWEFDPRHKDKMQWISMIRQPDFVTPQVFVQTLYAVQKKKPGLDLSLIKHQTWQEGLCVQCLHVGPYDQEPATFAAMRELMEIGGYVQDDDPIDAVKLGRRHHEIYLSDPRRSDPQSLKTILRLPIRKEA